MATASPHPFHGLAHSPSIAPPIPLGPAHRCDARSGGGAWGAGRVGPDGWERGRCSHGHGAAAPAAPPRSPRAARRPAGPTGGPHRRPAALPGHRCDGHPRTLSVPPGSSRSPWPRSWAALPTPFPSLLFRGLRGSLLLPGAPCSPSPCVCALGGVGRARAGPPFWGCSVPSGSGAVLGWGLPPGVATPSILHPNSRVGAP